MTVERARRGASFSLTRVDHTGITVSSLAESPAFWIEVLGFEHLYTWEFETSPFLDELVGVPGAALLLVMVDGFGHRIELLEYRAPADRKVMKPRSCDIGSVHIGMYVDDMDAALTRVGEADWWPVGEPQTVGEGNRKGLHLAYLRGPDGVTIEFLQEGSKPQAR